VVQSRQNAALGEFLANLRALEESREELHQMIRENNMERVVELTNVANAKWLIRTKNYYGKSGLLKLKKDFLKLIPINFRSNRPAHSSAEGVRGNGSAHGENLSRGLENHR